MRYNIHFLGLLLAFFFPQLAKTQIYTWANSLVANNDQEILCSALDPSGNLFIAGQFSGTIDFDPGPGTANRTASGNENAFIAKYTPAGAFLWAIAIKNNSNNNNGNNSRIKGITTTSNGHVYVVGSFNGTIDFDPTNTSRQESSNGTGNQEDDFFLAQYDASGACQRHFRRGNSQDDEATGVIVYQNKVYVIGTFKTQGLNPVDFDPSNGVAYRYTQGNLDGFIARYDLNFSYECVETYGGNNDDTPQSFTIDNTGAVIIVGRTNSTSIVFQGANTKPAGNVNADAFLVKYTLANSASSSPTVNYSWGFAYEGSSRKEALAVAVDASNNIYMGGRYDQTFDADPAPTGSFNLTGNGGFNAFLAKYDALGNFLAASPLTSSSGYDAIHNIKITGSNVYFAGVFGGSITPMNGSTPLPTINAVGNNDVLVGRCNQNLDYDWVFGIGSSQDDQANSIVISGIDFYISGVHRGQMDCDPSNAVQNVSHTNGMDMFFAKYTTCIAPTNPTIATALVSVCQGSTTRLIRTGGTLGSSAQWEWFMNNCSGAPVGSGDTLDLTVTTSATYYVRSAAGCAAPSGCAMATVLMDSTPTALIAAGDVTNARCAGGSTGRLSVSVQGGRPFYRYLWSSGGDSTSFSDSLSAGVYTVTVTDANQCSTTATATVGEPAALSGNINVSNVSCSGSRDGWLGVVPTGGTPNYTYAWATNPARTTAIIDSLSGGSFQVTIRDANGCTATLGASINEPALLMSMLDTSNTQGPSTCAGSDGQLAISTNGGIMPYTFVTSGQSPSNNNIITNLGAGIYNVSISDANGCQNLINHTLTEPSAISISTESTNVTCFSGAQGTLIATPSGGTEPYSYLWVNSMGVVVSTNDTATNIPAGAYSVTVTDDLYCSNFTAVTLSQPSALDDTTAITDASCLNCTDGSAVVILQGGTPPYTYQWSDGRTSAFRANMLPGVYVLYVSDSSGCRDTLTISIGITTGVQQLFNSSVQIFPNPTNGFLYVKGLPIRRRLMLINVLGQIVWRDENQYGDTQIDMQALPAATYWLRIETESDAVQIPVIKSNE